MPVNTPPSLPTSWTDSSVRASNLKDAINDVADAVNKLAAVGYAGWQSWTPALTSSGTAPGIGTHGVSGCVIHGRYCKVGRLVVATFNLRFATSGATKGTGYYYVSTPVTMKTAGYSAGMTSDLVGFGKLWRGHGTLDLGPGAHLDCTWHIADGTTGAKVLGVYSPGAQGGSIDRATKTSTQTGIGSSSTDVSSLTLSVTPERASARYRIVADVLAYKESGTGDIYVEITDGSNTVLRRTAVYATTYGTAFGTGVVPAHIEYVDEAPAFNTAKTYKVRAFGVDGTLAVFGSSDAPSSITVEELPGSSTGSLSEQDDYITATAPWEWDDNTSGGGGELWGVLVGESAA